MSTPDDGHDTETETERAERARRRARVFGEVLPETTDRGPSGEDDEAGNGEARGEDWLRANVPPHHGE